MKIENGTWEDALPWQETEEHLGVNPQILMQHMPWCRRIYAEINLDAVRSNVRHMKENLSPETQIIAVVKTDGYGHGAVSIARELEEFSFIWGFASATYEEAFALLKGKIEKPVLVLGYVFPFFYEEMIKNGIRITVFREDTLWDIKEAARRLKEKGISKKAIVHIKVDTGMGRIGVRCDEEGLSFVEKVFAVEEIEAEGIFTHLARADEADKTAALKQISLFQDFIGRIKEQTGREIPLKHCLNSAGLIELPQAGMDAARAGIILYGLWPSGEVRQDIVPLIPALSLYSSIVYVKEVEPGTQISYGGTFTAEKKMRIATVPAGYGDGYPRGLSGKGYVLVRGKKSPVLGRVCMDQFMIDVTEIPDAAEGDVVTLIGRDGAGQITLEQLGELSGRFNYEFACAIGKRVPRVYVKDGKILYAGECCQDF